MSRFTYTFFLSSVTLLISPSHSHIQFTEDRIDVSSKEHVLTDTCSFHVLYIVPLPSVFRSSCLCSCLSFSPIFLLLGTSRILQHCTSRWNDSQARRTKVGEPGYPHSAPTLTPGHVLRETNAQVECGSPIGISFSGKRELSCRVFRYFREACKQVSLFLNYLKVNAFDRVLRLRISIEFKNITIVV